uniref:Uncharacterized protein n=1 Tax=Chromera velia CCMP2878 TaxID=1169474 RepID=A0A0G4HL37_9ALVE|eukprot:Cvel_28670.t1-p1 / transcript=Cvel_28670.t1 / gene=Cvel_28670 / organism=Chromera_velia_CCMP2878 / gene_product=hypothetical protein / transcript_product=hypothetical protein / location=Cvel_scaffold3798:2149-8398(-) / protein_length=1090 / sequence_SO=supercontig / SO=protein_coding / is_pseudo=false
MSAEISAFLWQAAAEEHIAEPAVAVQRLQNLLQQNGVTVQSLKDAARGDFWGFLDQLKIEGVPLKFLNRLQSVLIKNSQPPPPAPPPGLSSLHQGTVSPQGHIQNPAMVSECLAENAPVPPDPFAVSQFLFLSQCIRLHLYLVHGPHVIWLFDVLIPALDSSRKANKRFGADPGEGLPRSCMRLSLIKLLIAFRTKDEPAVPLCPVRDIFVSLERALDVLADPVYVLPVQSPTETVVGPLGAAPDLNDDGECVYFRGVYLDIEFGGPESLLDCWKERESVGEALSAFLDCEDLTLQDAQTDGAGGEKNVTPESVTADRDGDGGEMEGGQVDGEEIGKEGEEQQKAEEEPYNKLLKFRKKESHTRRTQLAGQFYAITKFLCPEFSPSIATNGPCGINFRSDQVFEHPTKDGSLRVVLTPNARDTYLNPLHSRRVILERLPPQEWQLIEVAAVWEGVSGSGVALPLDRIDGWLKKVFGELDEKAVWNCGDKRPTGKAGGRKGKPPMTGMTKDSDPKSILRRFTTGSITVTPYVVAKKFPGDDPSGTREHPRMVAQLWIPLHPEQHPLGQKKKWVGDKRWKRCMHPTKCNNSREPCLHGRFDRSTDIASLCEDKHSIRMEETLYKAARRRRTQLVCVPCGKTFADTPEVPAKFFALDHLMGGEWHVKKSNGGPWPYPKPENIPGSLAPEHILVDPSDNEASEYEDYEVGDLRILEDYLEAAPASRFQDEFCPENQAFVSRARGPDPALTHQHVFFVKKDRVLSAKPELMQRISQLTQASGLSGGACGTGGAGGSRPPSADRLRGGRRDEDSGSEGGWGAPPPSFGWGRSTMSGVGREDWGSSHSVSRPPSPSAGNIRPAPVTRSPSNATGSSARSSRKGDILTPVAGSAVNSTQLPSGDFRKHPRSGRLSESQSETLSADRRSSAPPEHDGGGRGGRSTRDSSQLQVDITRIEPLQLEIEDDGVEEAFQGPGGGRSMGMGMQRPGSTVGSAPLGSGFASLLGPGSPEGLFFQDLMQVSAGPSDPFPPTEAGADRGSAAVLQMSSLGDALPPDATVVQTEGVLGSPLPSETYGGALQRDLRDGEEEGGQKGLQG